MVFENLLPGLKKNILLSQYTSFKTGGKARYFFITKEKKDLIKTIKIAKEINLPFFILGAGTNVLFSDKGFKGLVVKIQSLNFKFKDLNIIAEAGVPLGLLVNNSFKKSFSGLEWAIGIPGTLGGAIYGNAGAFGFSMADVIKSVEVLKIDNKKRRNFNFQIKIFKNKDCQFRYRDSIFKKNKNLIILSAVIQLKKEDKNKIKEKLKEYLNYRKENQPLNFPSAGSVFKNPAGYSAGELIEKCNLKGKQIGGVKISEKHANFIINLGKGKTEEVKKIIKLIKKEVKKKFGIILEEEIEFF